MILTTLLSVSYINKCDLKVKKKEGYYYITSAPVEKKRANIYSPILCVCGPCILECFPLSDVFSLLYAGNQKLLFCILDCKSLGSITCRHHFSFLLHFEAVDNMVFCVFIETDGPKRLFFHHCDNFVFFGK